MAACLIGLGSNLGPPHATLARAWEFLANEPAITLLARSTQRQTQPVGGPAGQPPYLNAAALLATALSPEALLARLQGIEQQLGRTRTAHWGPRTLDLDLLLYDQAVIRTPELVVPHPRMAWRRFMLQPAAEIAPDMLHPTTGWTIARLLAHLDTAVPYLAIAGPIAAGKTALAQAIAARSGARGIEEAIDGSILAEFYRDPAEKAWQTEVHFLRQRAAQLSARDPAWSDRRQWTVSDFWFDQSWAFAGVWLPPPRREEFHHLWQEARRGVPRPKLTVLLDAPPEELHARILSRGRPCERDLSIEQLQQIRQAIRAQAAVADQGPLLELAGGTSATALDEVLAAMQAMQ
jgi:2-amino-4-hydroxy-6-hydroxymethyldihydropteridine diphosphokinase